MKLKINHKTNTCQLNSYIIMVVLIYKTNDCQCNFLKRELIYANEENTKLKNELRRIKANIEAAEVSGSSNSVSNVDLLRRLSQLEKVVYGKSEE